ncbi:MAG: FmdB family zinc ribbon protein [Thermomicrobiales bacterium]
MPTYHYRCINCAHEFDQFQKFSEDALTVCPECEGQIKRVLQPVGIVFKGSGWYITDSRESSSGAAKAASPSSGDSKETKGPEPAKSSTETKSKEPAKAAASTSSDA